MLPKIPDFSTANVLVVGDVMLDRYWHGGTSRISPEAPVPIVHVKQQENRPGGAANVAVNLAALGVHSSLIGICGTDEAGSILRQTLQQYQIQDALIQNRDLQTIVKLRVLSRNQQLLRLDFEQGFSAFPQEQLYQHVAQQLPAHQVMILSDYHKGTIGDHQLLIQLAHRAGIPVLIDPKGNDYRIYRNATLLTPNQSEFEAIVGKCSSEEMLLERGLRLVQELNLQALLVTRSEQGMTLIEANGSHLTIPAVAREVFDVTGAGDTVIATLAASLACHLPLTEGMALANMAASLVVEKLGAASVTKEELQLLVESHPGISNYGVVEEDVLLVALAQARARGEKIVMTNGCFDLLHAGHVQYLRQARQLGDRLILALNTDDSIRRLKGKNRPIIPFAERAQVLAALDCIDWVVGFSDDTPERLISDIQPNILVKGGDNDPDLIPGSQQVRANGGEVRVLPFVTGCSTTRIIQRIQERYQ